MARRIDAGSRKTLTPYGVIVVTADGWKFFTATGDETEVWSRRPGARWPNSQLEGRDVGATIAHNGDLVDVEFPNGDEPDDLTSDELNAWMNDIETYMTAGPVGRLRHHVTGAIERGEKEPIIGIGKPFAENPRKNVTDVARAFNDGKRKGKPGDSIWTDGEAIYSYNTALLVKLPYRPQEEYYGLAPGLVLNKTRYSVTTTQQQHGLHEMFGQRIEYFVDGLDRGVPAFRVLEAAGID